MKPALFLERQGFEIIRLSTKGGIIDSNELEAALNERVILVSIMAANNETGAIYDLASLFPLVHRLSPKALTHTDAVQAFGKIPLYPEKIEADMVTISAHKIRGIKGAGALYVSRDVLKRRQLVPLIHGGGQEGGIRSGTESIPCIAGFGQAAKDQKEVGAAAVTEKTALLRDHLLSCLDSRLQINQPKGSYLPGIVSITLPQIRSEIMLRYLSERGIFVSAGSACSSHHNTASPVLLAFGLSAKEADCTIRVSFSHEETKENLSHFASVLSEGMDTLAKIRETRK
jgi:cysteine desulfurase